MSKYGVNGSYWKKSVIKDDRKDVVVNKEVVKLDRMIKKEEDEFKKGCKIVVSSRYYGKKVGMKKTGRKALSWNSQKMGCFVDEDGNEAWYRKEGVLSDCEISRREVVKLVSKKILLENNMDIEKFNKEWKNKIK
jgi:hypothetical protein